MGVNSASHVFLFPFLELASEGSKGGCFVRKRVISLQVCFPNVCFECVRFKRRSRYSSLHLRTTNAFSPSLSLSSVEPYPKRFGKPQGPRPEPKKCNEAKKRKEAK